MIQQFSNVHSLGDIPKEGVVNKSVNCPICDYSDISEDLVIKHIEEVYQLVDQGTKKTNKRCRFFQQNRCFKGHNCKFIHEKIAQTLNETETNKNE